MNRKWWISIAIMWLALPAVALRYWSVWDSLPLRMATHFNAANQPNGWMTREASLMFILGLMAFLLALFTVILSFIRKPDTGTWAVLGLFYVILAVVYRISDLVIDYNLTGQPLSLIPIVVTLMAAIIAVVVIFLVSQRGQNLPASSVLAEEVHAGQWWGLGLFIPAAIELAVAVAIPNPVLRLSLGLTALILVASGGMAWSGFRYLFTREGVEVRTLGFRLRSIPREQIKEYAVAPWSIIGGYGIRGLGGNRAYVWGNRGVRIKTSEGEIFLGHSNPERIVHDLDVIKQFAH